MLLAACPPCLAGALFAMPFMSAYEAKKEKDFINSCNLAFKSKPEEDFTYCSDESLLAATETFLSAKNEVMLELLLAPLSGGKLIFPLPKIEIFSRKDLNN